jgi:hypothetical protein
MDRKSHRGVDLPIFEETMRNLDKLSIRRDTVGRWTEDVPETGWYQDKSGNLYQYDGVIWDEVPKDRVSDLEYLG